MVYLKTWGKDWPDTMQLGEASSVLGFDLFEHDEEFMILLKTVMPIGKAVAQDTMESILQNDGNDDRFVSLSAGFDIGGRNVPPVVVLPGEGLRDGNHRVLLASSRGWSHVTAYLPLETFGALA